MDFKFPSELTHEKLIMLPIMPLASCLSCFLQDKHDASGMIERLFVLTRSLSVNELFFCCLEKDHKSSIMNKLRKLMYETIL